LTEVERAILQTIHAAGYIVRQREHEGEFIVEAQDPKTGHRTMVKAPTLLEAASTLADKLGFDLEA
jgi:hypothetical protein